MSWSAAFDTPMSVSQLTATRCAKNENAQQRNRSSGMPGLMWLMGQT